MGHQGAQEGDVTPIVESFSQKSLEGYRYRGLLGGCPLGQTQVHVFLSLQVPGLVPGFQRAASTSAIIN